MGKYSLEPSRRDLVLHLTFDDYSQASEPLDISPQANHATIASGSPTRRFGGLGDGLLFRNSDQLTISDVDLDLTSHGITLSSTIAVKRNMPGSDPFQVVGTWNDLAFGVYADSNDDIYVKAYLGGSATAISVPREVGEIFHVTVVYNENSTTRTIYIDGRKLAVDTVGTVGDYSGEVQLGNGTNYNMTDEAVIGGARIYRKGVAPSVAEALSTMALKRTEADNMGDAWDNQGIPFLYGNSNERLASTLAEHQAESRRRADEIRDAIHIQTASGHELNLIGRGHGVLRETNETDAHYRARIIATLAAGRSRGTFNDILEATAAVVDTETSEIEIREEYETAPATAFIYIKDADLNAVELTSTEVEEILEDTVPGGHRVNVIRTGDQPFTLIKDGEANNPELGLTSDSISTGGTLTSDV